MSYKPDESALMAYLYGEVEGQEKERIEQYLLQNPEARKDLENLKSVRKIMTSWKTKKLLHRLFSSIRKPGTSPFGIHLISKR